jgi:hypothetical protein
MKEFEQVILFDVYLYKNEYKIFNPVEITLRRGLGRKKKNRGNEPLQVIIHTYIEMSE